MKPKILITDDEVHVANVIDDLHAIAEVVKCENNREETLISAVKNVDLIIVSCFTRITARVFGNAKKLKAVLKYGVGVDNIDLEAATRKGALVVNCPQYGSDTIAEHAFALILCLAKKLIQIDKVMRKKAWIWPSQKFLGIDLLGKTIGLIGFGRIGRAMARKAGGFGMKIIIYDPYIDPDLVKDFAARLVSLDTLLQTADVVSIHCILTPETENLIDAQKLQHMKQTSLLIDVSRGAIIDEKALAAALKQNRIAGAGLDVFAQEPLNSNHPFLDLENVILTPHLAWYTKEAYERLEKETLQRASEVLEGKIPRNIKNPEVLEKWDLG
jgi:D-3-phosphoglycerate dehydrogenase